MAPWVRRVMYVLADKINKNNFLQRADDPGNRCKTLLAAHFVLEKYKMDDIIGVAPHSSQAKKYKKKQKVFGLLRTDSAFAGGDRKFRFCNSYFLPLRVPLRAKSTFRGLHCKKRLAVFPSPAGMSLTQLSLDGKN
jgi:hypothetical protein